MKKGFREFKRRYANGHINVRGAVSLFLTAAVVLSLFVMIPASADNLWGVESYPIMVGYTEKTKPTSTNWSFGISDYSQESQFAVSTAGFSAPVAVFNSGDGVESFTWSEIDGADSYKIEIYKDTDRLVSETVTDTQYTTAYGVIAGGEDYLAQVKAMKGGRAKACSEICSFTADESLISTGYPQTKNDSTVYIADGYTANTSALINSETGAGYTFINNNYGREVVFNAVSEGGKKYGSYLTFTAPEDGLYDLLGNVRIRDNATAKNAGTLYFRVVKKDNQDKEKVVYPLDGGWMTTDSSDVIPEPYMENVAPQVELKSGEKAVLQSYFDGNGKINIGLSNMTAVRQQSEESYKGTVTEYPFKDYTPHFMFDGTNNGFTSLEGRWTANIFKQTDADGFQEMTFDNYGSWRMCKRRTEGEDVGYYFYTDETDPMKLQVGYGGYGISYNFVSPETGKLSLSVAMTSAEANYEKYRVVHNGVTVFPENGGWETVTSKTPNINVTVDAKDDDVLQFQYYNSGADRNLPQVPTLTAGISSGNDANSVDGNVFSPLWERPWDGKTYDGDFTPLSGSVWEMDFWDATGGARVKNYKTGNKFNSTTGVITYKDPENKNAGCEDTEFIFKKEEMQVKLTKKASAVSLSFITPVRGNYDLSAALKLIEGEGTLYARVLKNNKAIYPSDPDSTTPWSIWQTFTDSLDLNALEISAGAGDKIRLEIYGVKSDWTDPLVVSLGTPVITRLSNRESTATGNISVYKPYDYLAFEKGYSGKYTRANARFNYYFTPSGGTKTAVTDTNSAKSDLSAGSNSLSFEADATTLNLKSGAVGEIEFSAPAKASGELQAAAVATSGSAQFAIYKNGREVAPYSADIAPTTSIDLEKGDKLSIYVKASGDTKVKFTALNVKLGGEHYNQNAPEDDAFYALYSAPYSDDAYTGDYQKSDSVYWNFDGYKVSSDSIIPTDKYNDKKLYSNATETSYTFGNPYLTADFTTHDGGIALGFTAPRADTFAMRSGFRITTANITADIKAKLIKISADGNSKTQVWPATDGEWYTQSVATDDDIEIPFINVEMALGDKLYLLAFAENQTSERLNINLVCPSVSKDVVRDYTNPDISASLYQAWQYSPYTALYPYTNNSVYIPMENRWNFEMTEVSAENNITDTLYANYIINTGSTDEIIYKPMSGWPKYQVKDNVGSSMVIDATKNIGSQIRFVAPKTCEMSINAAPSATVPEGITVNYRILHKKADGTEETLWPKNGGWEPLTASQGTSLSKDVNVNVVAGEEIWLQSYIVRDAAAEEKIAASTRLSVGMSMAPVAVITNGITENKTNFSAMAGFPMDLQLSPYWKYEYAVDADSPIWLPATRWSWNYWLSPAHTYMGISNQMKMWIANTVEHKSTGLIPAVCVKYTPREHGFVTMSSSKGAGYIGENKIEGRVRITKNGENIYPASGWANVPASFKGVEFEVDKGDEIRFEFAVKEPLKIDDSLYVSWNPTFTQNKYSNYYNISDDIYTYLDDTMLKTFQGMSGKGGFDQDPAASKKFSEEIAKRKEQAALIGAMQDNIEETPDVPDYNYSDDGYWETPGTEGTEGDYSEWTEEIYTPGGGYKKIFRTTTTLWWIWLIVGIVAAVLVAGITVLLILNKKGKINLFRKKAIRR